MVTELWLYNNQLTDVKELEKLTQLTKLSFSYNSLNDVKDLEKFTQLKWLNLGGNKLTDVKGLEKFTQLTKLDYHGNKLTRFSCEIMVKVVGIETKPIIYHLFQCVFHRAFIPLDCNQ